MRLLLSVLLLLLPAVLVGAEWRIVEVVRAGPPPHLEEDRLYRIEGEGCHRLPTGSFLQVQRPEDGRPCGTLVVVQVGATFVLAKLAKKADTYPLKGDLTFPSEGPAKPPPMPILAARSSGGLGTTTAPLEPSKGVLPVVPQVPPPRTSGGRWKIPIRLPEVGPFQARWMLGLIRQTPALLGNYYKQSGSSLDSFDIARDLQLARSGAPLGLFVDVMGARFLLHVGTYNVAYRGHAVIEQAVNLDTTSYHPGALVQSEVSLRDYEVDWTTKVWWSDRAYIGVDLGVNYWVIQATAVGQGYLQSDPTTQVLSTTKASMLFPIPQIGISAGLEAFGGLTARGYFHIVQMKGASYQRFGVDLRYFPLKHWGLRANYEREGFKAPLGSISNNMALRLDKNGAGFGVLVRY